MKTSGYTLFELLVVLLMLGLLAVVAVPAFIGFLQRQRVRVAASLVYQILFLARNQAASEKVDYAVDFRRDFEGFSYCVRQSSSQCLIWQSFTDVYFSRCTFPSNGQNFSVTKLAVGDTCTAGFSWTGAVKGRLGGVYLKPNPQSRYCRGVWTKTLLSALDNREIDRCED